MVADQFVHGCANQNGILLILQNLQVTLRRKNREDAGNDAWATGKLILSRLIETECAYRVGNGLNNLNIPVSLNGGRRKLRSLPRSQAQGLPRWLCRRLGGVQPLG